MSKVSVVMGSDRDFDIMKEAVEILQEAGVKVEVKVMSIHKSPEKTIAYAKALDKQETEVIIAGAGAAFHLAGVIAGLTTIPVIAVPLALPPFQGWDALLSSLQMPAGIPVAVMSVGKWGAKNAALFALRILALKDANLQQFLLHHREKLAKEVEEKENRVKKCRE